MLTSIHRVVYDVEQSQQILAPLVKLEVQSIETLHLTGLTEALRSGRFKRKVRCSFQIKDIKYLHIITPNILEIINGGKFDVILLYQYQAVQSKFEFYVSCKGYARSIAFDKAVMATITQICGCRDNISQFTFCKGNGPVSDSAMRERLSQISGYHLQHRLIDYYCPSQTTSSEHGNGQSQSSHRQNTTTHSISNVPTSGIVLKNRKGQIFDIQVFARGCIKVAENLLFFTRDDYIRSQQLQTNKEVQVQELRLTNNRPLLQKVWMNTIKYVLRQEGAQELADIFTMEQVANLFDSQLQELVQTYNQFVLGQKAQCIVQPHPVRALMENASYLEATSCMDMCIYNFRQYTLNWMVAAYFVGKNFLTQDSALTNTQGAMCFAGSPGSGKSKFASVLYQFMNGFQFQDTERGITEFWNSDIVTKSFIRAEEVSLKRLISSDWKMLADIELSIKCRVKNQQDLEATKWVPVVITTNDCIYEGLVKKQFEDSNYEAAHRRWAFIRFVEVFENGHPELYDCMHKMLPEFECIYKNKTLNHQLMNSIIACALIFPAHQYALPQYISSYYAHCLDQFSQTFFGQIVLTNIEQFLAICNETIAVYQYQTDAAVFQKQHAMARRFDSLVLNYFNIYFGDDQHVMEIIQNENEPMYYRFLKLSSNMQIQNKLKQEAAHILKTFLCNKQHIPVYHMILQQIEEVSLQVENEFIMPESPNSELGRIELSGDVFQFDMVESLINQNGKGMTVGESFKRKIDFSNSSGLHFSQ